MPTVQRPKDFLDLIAPGAVLFNTDHSVFGNTYRTVMMLRGYPPTTEEQALLRQLGELEGVTVHLAVRKVTAAEEEAILHAATNKSRMERSNVSNVKQSVTAEAKLQDTASLILGMRRDREPLLHTSVFLELTAKTMEELQRLRDSVSAILLRGKLTTDPLLLRQRDGLRRHLYRRADGGRGCHGGAAARPGHSGVRRVPGGGVGGPHLNRPDSHGRRSARRTGRRRSFPPRHGLQPGENVVDSKP